MGSLFSATKEFAGKEYELGKMDCLRLIYDFLINYGYSPPDHYSGYTLDTYKLAYLKDKDSALNLMVRYFESFLFPIEHNRIQPGDVLIMNFRGYTDIATGILVGNRKVLTVTMEGVKLLSVDLFNVVRGFRCHN